MEEIFRDVFTRILRSTRNPEPPTLTIANWPCSVSPVRIFMEVQRHFTTHSVSHECSHSFQQFLTESGNATLLSAMPSCIEFALQEYKSHESELVSKLLKPEFLCYDTSSMSDWEEESGPLHAKGKLKRSVYKFLPIREHRTEWGCDRNHPAKVGFTVTYTQFEAMASGYMGHRMEIHRVKKRKSHL